MENLRAQNKSPHSVYEFFDKRLTAFRRRQVIIAQVEELNSFAPFDQVHDFDYLVWKKRVPRQAQVLDAFVCLKEHAKVLEQLGVVEADWLKV